jgi:hypothetical protein
MYLRRSAPIADIIIFQKKLHVMEKGDTAIENGAELEVFKLQVA